MAKLPSSTFALDFLRRLLCAHSAATTATGRCATAQNGGSAVQRPTQEPSPTEPEGRSPCIVARLMGLDTMPAEPRGQQQPLRRSRSASPAEGFGDAPLPRAIRASASFREKPTYLRPENDEFLLLSFSPEERHHDDKAELFLLASRSDDDEDDAETARRGKRRDRARKQRRGRRKLQYCADEEAESASDLSRRAAAAAECAGECGLQNSSPVSVLEARDGQESSSTSTTSCSLEELEQAEPGSPSPEEVQPQLKPQGGPRRKPQHDFDDLGDLSHAASTCHVSKCSDMERRNRRAVNKAEVITPDVAGIWQLICRLAEEDLNNMKCATRDDVNISAELESEILDELICEATDELMQLRSDRNCTCFPSLLLLQEALMLQKCSE